MSALMRGFKIFPVNKLWVPSLTDELNKIFGVCVFNIISHDDTFFKDYLLAIYFWIHFSIPCLGCLYTFQCDTEPTMFSVSIWGFHMSYANLFHFFFFFKELHKVRVLIIF